MALLSRRALSPADGSDPVTMGKYFICALSPKLVENYEIGVRRGKWGVEEKYQNRIEAVSVGDYLIFVVESEFRSIHRITRGPYREDDVLIWPRKNGDLFPYRVDIGPAEASGRIRVQDLAPAIAYLRPGLSKKFMGRNGVFNPTSRRKKAAWSGTVSAFPTASRRSRRSFTSRQR
jgi:predicted RNA-binding protein